MIYICNNCVGARIYQLLNLQFNNPFIWCRITSDDMLFLIQNFNDIDFLRFELKSYHDILLNQKIYGVNVDDKITIWYPHYKYGNYDTPTKNNNVNGLDIFYKNIEEYIIKKYKIRTTRMIQSLENHESIQYIIVEDNKQDNMNYTNEQLQKFINLHLPVLKYYNLSTIEIAKKYLKLK